MIDTVIWDIGGVFVRTTNKIPRTLLAEKYSLRYSDLDQLVFGSQSSLEAEVGLKTADAHWRWVGEQLSITTDELSEFRKTFFGGDTLDKKLVKYIRDLSADFRLGLLSNTWDNARGFLAGFDRGFLELFDVIYISAEKGKRKPDVTVYTGILNELGSPAEKAIFIDDSQTNLDGAIKAGLQAVKYQSTPQVIFELNQILNRDKK